MTESTTANQPIPRYQTVNERRSKLLKMEGEGYTTLDIVKHLSQTYHCTERNIYRDFQTRKTWQPHLLDSRNAVLKIINCLWQEYQTAAFKQRTTHSENAQIGWSRVKVDVLTTLLERYGVELRDLQEPIEVRVGWEPQKITAAWENKFDQKEDSACQTSS